MGLAGAVLEGGALTTALQQVARHLATHAARCQLAHKQPRLAGTAFCTACNLRGLLSGKTYVIHNIWTATLPGSPSITIMAIFFSTPMF